KLALNCAINPLTVLHECRNGELSAHRDEVGSLCKELSTLLTACGQPQAAQDLETEVWRVVEATANNYSSMYQDVQLGRRTEVAYLLGYACAATARHQLGLPRLRAVHQQLRARLVHRGLPVD